VRISRKSVGFAAVVAASALVLAACSSNSSSNPSKNLDTTAVITANGSEPQNPLIPTNTNETGGGKIVDSLFAGLVYYDAKGKPVNEVADSVTTTDAQNYTIKLKTGWKFTNGEAVTSKSFVDAWNYGALLSNAQLNGYFFESIDGFSYDVDSKLTGLTVVDDTTFTMKLKQPEADFPLRLGYTAFFPLPQAAYADMKAFGENPIGDGPYKFASPTAWQHNVKLDLVPNPDYTGGRKPANGGVSFVFYQSQDSAYNDLLAGNLDVLDAVPDSALAKYKMDLGDRAVNQPAAIFQAFTIPQNLPHFTGAEGALRRAAISQSIDRKLITDKIFSATRTPASDFTSPVINGWSDKIPGSDVLKFDATKAKDLWKQADAISPWSGTFTIGYNSDGGHQAWVDAVTNSIKNTLGIDAQGKPYSTFKELRTDITKRTITGAFRSGWQADYPGLFNFLGPTLGTNASSNDGDYTNPAFDQLLKDGSAADSVDKANVIFQKAQEILFKDLPVIPLWYSNVTGGSATTVTNVVFGWNSQPLYYEVSKIKK